ncbi:hypothetical protein GUJ93_ZPchr0002g24126 [Zizania palustris]|uniref:Uncharacterized protein n=1 Tax=Zizania palustris TaxID=103762 RepID=A0A8J5S1N8_ZIZPA|nr:hypothetical protein GUJ93_ZPchr0002g24126 [Zizania palustris]
MQPEPNRERTVSHGRPADSPLGPTRMRAAAAAAAAGSGPDRTGPDRAGQHGRVVNGLTGPAFLLSSGSSSSSSSSSFSCARALGLSSLPPTAEKSSTTACGPGLQPKTSLTNPKLPFFRQLRWVEGFPELLGERSPRLLLGWPLARRRTSCSDFCCLLGWWDCERGSGLLRSWLAGVSWAASLAGFTAAADQGNMMFMWIS